MVDKFEVGKKYQYNGESHEYEVLFIGPEGNAVAKYNENGKTQGGTLQFSTHCYYTEVVKKRTFWFGCNDASSTYFESGKGHLENNDDKNKSKYDENYRWIKVEL